MMNVISIGRFLAVSFIPVAKYNMFEPVQPSSHALRFIPVTPLRSVIASASVVHCVPLLACLRPQPSSTAAAASATANVPAASFSLDRVHVSVAPQMGSTALVFPSD